MPLGGEQREILKEDELHQCLSLHSFGQRESVPSLFSVISNKNKIIHQNKQTNQHFPLKKQINYL